MSNLVKIAILNCPGGKDWGPIYTSYFNKYVEGTNFIFEYTVIDVSNVDSMNSSLGTFEFNGYVITGSTHDAYDNQDWILNLIEIIRNINLEKKRLLLGICFGHQIICRALGGEVSLSDKGWGVGPRSIELNEEAKTIFQELQQHYKYILNQADSEVPCLSIEDKIVLHYSHQDQVTTPPPETELKCGGGNGHCPFAVSYQIGVGAEGGKPLVQVLTFQGHPEFSSHLMQEIIAMLKGMGAYGSGENEGSRLGYSDSLLDVESQVSALCRLGETKGDDSALHNSAIGKCIVAFFCQRT